MFHSNKDKNLINRRKFTYKMITGGCVIALPKFALSAVSKLTKPVKLGLIADLHHDVMHDGLERLNSFISAMKAENPDALIQMGYFAYPNEKNKKVKFVKGEDKNIKITSNGKQARTLIANCSGYGVK